MPMITNCNPATKSELREFNGKLLSHDVKKQEIGKSRTLLRRYKQKLTSLSKVERQVAIGIMLGDASLQTQDGGKSYRLKLLQGDKNKDYLFHLCTVFSRWIPIPSESSVQDNWEKSKGLEKPNYISQGL
jgi:hypothetical protein